MPALALTDLCNVFGLVKFYQAARGKGIKPVVGCDVWMTNEHDRDKPSRALLLCQSREGYHRLCELLSRAYRRNQYRNRAEIRREWLRELGTEGLIALSGAMEGEIGQALLVDNRAMAEAAATQWSELFPNRFYIELQRAGHAHEDAYVGSAAQLGARLRLPVVATHPVQFLTPDDFKAHEARVCISQGYVLSDRRRPRHFTDQQYFKSQEEMARLFADIPSALRNSVEIAKRCSTEIELGKSRLPLFPTPNGMGLDEFLRAQSLEGLERRLVLLYPDEEERAKQRPRYVERLQTEIGTIIKMGFPGYFLIVADFINWAKGNGVPVGPGRGSGAGSLVAYSLGITDLDPLRYDLLFERFLNPERVSMPDFDVDFCQDGRDRVIDYVRQKYGADSVSQIATFGTMAAKAVVRDVGRVLDLPYNFCDQLAKLIPFQPGKLITLKMAREMEPLLAQREQNEEEVRELLALGESLEGMTRNVGMHAGGVLIAPGKLTDFCPLYCAEGNEAVVSQLDKDDVEAVGLVKFDFLGLTTLTILDWTLSFIRRLHEAGQVGETAPVLEALPLDDAQAYRIFATGNTTAVFQFESRGMRDLLKRARPDRFEDIIALVALYRPGPMELIPDFIDRKHGRQKVEYLDPRLEPILGETYGIMVYQEQVMQIAQVIGGYTLGGADLLRRAMGKKKPEEMAKHRDIFVEGAKKNGLTETTGNQLFDLMEKFAGYGFNKSHAAAYALVAYQTAYMKAHHPAAFMAANLSAVMDDTDKVHQLVEDAIDNGLKILPPDINQSEYRFVPVDPGSIRYGLGGIKGTGHAAIEAILQSRRERSAFRSLFDFCQRMDKRLVNRRVLEALIRAGAFDSIDDHRARLFASAGIAIEGAEQRSRAVGQSSLFGAETDDDSGGLGQKLIERPRWSERQRLQEEKQALGFYLSGHPYNVYRPELQRFVRTSLSRLQPAHDGEGQQRSQIIAGIVDGVRWANTQNGRMLIVTLSDGTGSQEVTVYNEVADHARNLIKEDALLVIEARVRLVRRSSAEEGEESFLRVGAEKVYDLAAARARFARGLELICNGGSNGTRLRELLAPYRAGGCPVSVHYANREAQCRIDLGDEWRVKPDDTLIEALSDWLQPENVQLVY